MAWNSPKTMVNGDPTLVSDWNTYVKDNLNAIWVGTAAGDLAYWTSSTARTRLGIGTPGQVLKTNSGGTAPEWGGTTLSKSTTVVTPSNTAETDVWSTTLTGGVLGTGGLITGCFFFIFTPGSGYTITCKMYYGATAITGTHAPGGSTANSIVCVQFMLMGNGATNSQRMSFQGVTEYDTGGTRKQTIEAYGTAAIDSTANATFKFALQQSNTGLALSFLSGYYSVR